MNRIVLLILSSLYLLSIQAQKTFYVYRNDGIRNQFVTANVKSVELSNIGLDGSEYPDFVVQEIHTNEGITRIPLELIDSVSFYVPDPAKSISEAYIPIDWEKTKLLSCDPTSGRYSLSYTDNDPNIKEGSVVVIETDAGSRVILVTEVNKSGNKYEIGGEVGDISYLFYDTEFTLTTETENKNAQTRGYMDKSFRYAARENVIEIDAEPQRFTANLWKYKGEEYINDLYKKGNVHAYTKSKFGLNLDFEANIRFGDKTVKEIGGIKFIAAKDVDVDANIKGSMNADYDLCVDLEKETQFDLAPNEKDKYVALKRNLFPRIPLHFPVGAVVLEIVLGADLLADVSLKGSGELHFSSGIGAHSETMIGAKYNTKNETKIESYYKKPSFDITPHSPTVSGKGKLSGKLHLFPRVHAWLYGVTGPSFDIKPFIRADLSGGFQKDLLQNSSSDYFAWSVETFYGLDIAVGLSVSDIFQSNEVWNKSTDDIQVFDAPLYKSPSNIKFLSATPDEIKKGTKTTVKFEVYDKGYDGEDVMTPLPQLVKFEGKGSIEATVGNYGIAQSGIVTASWTPSSASDSLYATLYNIDGEVIAKAAYGKEPSITFSVKQDSIFYRNYYDETGKGYGGYFEVDHSLNITGIPDIEDNLYNYGFCVIDKEKPEEYYFYYLGDYMKYNGDYRWTFPSDRFHADQNAYVATCYDQFECAIIRLDDGQIFDLQPLNIVYDQKPKITFKNVNMESSTNYKSDSDNYEYNFSWINCYASEVWEGSYWIKRLNHEECQGALSFDSLYDWNERVFTKSYSFWLDSDFYIWDGQRDYRYSSIYYDFNQGKLFSDYYYVIDLTNGRSIYSDNSIVFKEEAGGVGVSLAPKGGYVHNSTRQANETKSQYLDDKQNAKGYSERIRMETSSNAHRWLDAQKDIRKGHPNDGRINRPHKFLLSQPQKVVKITEEKIETK
jgi:hypothetical protein